MGRVPIVNTSTSLAQLPDLLTRESTQCDLLAQNIVQERDAIKRMALSEFLSINQSRVTILESLHRLKEEFDLLVEDLANTYQVPMSDRTVTEILHRAQSPQTEIILQQYERLAERVRAVKQDIAANQVLIHKISIQNPVLGSISICRRRSSDGRGDDRWDLVH
jgi:predicted transcriptional regulator